MRERHKRIGEGRVVPAADPSWEGFVRNFCVWGPKPFDPIDVVSGKHSPAQVWSCPEGPSVMGEMETRDGKSP